MAIESGRATMAVPARSFRRRPLPDASDPVELAAGLAAV